MPMSVVYTTVNGQILCENRGGVVSHFVSDPLGSVVMVRDSAGNTVYEAEYDPYGNVQSETGTNPSEFGYVGTLGYVKDSASSLYVRARYLLTNLGRWLTKDPLWPEEPGYVYATADPISYVDESGLRPCTAAEKACCDALCAGFGLHTGKCTATQVVMIVDVDCDCGAKPCPKPITTSAQAKREGADRMRLRYGKCSPSKTGPTVPAKACDGGTHQTTTYSCGKKSVSLSVICCPCKDSGTQRMNCRASVHESGK